LRVGGHKGAPGPVSLELFQDLVQDGVLLPVVIRRVVAHPLAPGQTNNERLHPEDRLDLAEGRLEDASGEAVELVTTLTTVVVLKEDGVSDVERHVKTVVLLWTSDLDQCV